MDLELIRSARRADLISFLLLRGEPLVKEGLRYRHKVHSSLVFTSSAYYWNSRQLHGNPIDFLMLFYGMRFIDAVTALTENTLTAITAIVNNREQIDLFITNVLPQNECKRAIAFLTKTRMIDYSVVKMLVNIKHIYQESITNNILFPMYDEAGLCIGAEVQGSLSDKRFKGIKANSKYGYGFNVRFSDNNVFNYALFFESAVDLLSFIDLKTLCDKKTLENCILISMSGLKINVIETLVNIFNTNVTPLQIVMCIDNDKPAANFLMSLNRHHIKYIDCRPDRSFKDYNEQLIAAKCLSMN